MRNRRLLQTLWRWLWPPLLTCLWLFSSVTYLSAALPTPTVPNGTTPSNTSHPLTQPVQSFIEHYFDALARNDVETLSHFYAETVNYYTWGMVERSLVAAEKRDYFERWPEVKQSLIGEIDIQDTAKADEKQVSFLLRFSVRNPQADTSLNRITGTARQTWCLRVLSDGFAILAEEQQVLIRQRRHD